MPGKYKIINFTRPSDRFSPDRSEELESISNGYTLGAGGEPVLAAAGLAEVGSDALTCFRLLWQEPIFENGLLDIIFPIIDSKVFLFDFFLFKRFATWANTDWESLTFVNFELNSRDSGSLAVIQWYD